MTALLAAQVTLTGTALGIALTRPTHATVSAIDSSPVAAQTTLARAPVGAAATPAAGRVSLALTAADHHDCPATATACADLSRHRSTCRSGPRSSSSSPARR